MRVRADTMTHARRADASKASSSIVPMAAMSWPPYASLSPAKGYAFVDAALIGHTLRECYHLVMRLEAVGY